LVHSKAFGHIQLPNEQHLDRLMRCGSCQPQAVHYLLSHRDVKLPETKLHWRTVQEAFHLQNFCEKRGDFKLKMIPFQRVFNRFSIHARLEGELLSEQLIKQFF